MSETRLQFIKNLVAEEQPWLGQADAKLLLDEIERLKSELEVWKANAETNLGEVERLRTTLAKSCEEGRDEMYDCGYNRLRAVLERIATRDYPETAQEFAREALNKEKRSDCI